MGGADESAARLDSECDVAVVGAGLSGLTAARALLRAGIRRVVVVEARQRVGGRTLSRALGEDDAFDLGGQWVGPAQHLVLALVRELGLQLVRQPWFEDAPAPDSNSETGDLPVAPTSRPAGQEGPGQERVTSGLSSGGSSALAPAEAAELGCLMQQLDAMAATVHGPPWRRCPHAAEWDGLSARDWLAANVRQEAVMREMVLFVETVLSCEPEQLSFLYLLYYVHMSGGMAQLADGEGGAQTWRLRGGAQQLSLGLARQVQALGGRLLLGRPVRGVVGWQDTAPASHVAESRAQEQGPAPVGGDHGARGPARLLLEGGEVLHARHVVLALPPPVWSHTMRFDPPLPEPKQELGRSMFMGCTVKCFMLFRRAFWQDPGAQPRGRLEALGPVANLFPACVAGRPALVGLATAARAAELRLLAETEQRQQVLRQVAAYFGLSHKAVEEEEQHFAASCFTGDEFSGGCFTALMPPGLATRCGDALRLPEGRIHFAGSETAQYCVGYFEGALEAGARAAAEVLQARLGLRPSAAGTPVQSASVAEGPKQSVSLASSL